MSSIFISKRSSVSEGFDERKVELKIGMCITGRVDENLDVINSNHGHALPYPYFAYIVDKISDSEIELLDCQYNNRWTIKPDDLKECELVANFHSSNYSIDASRINDVLS